MQTEICEDDSKTEQPLSISFLVVNTNMLLKLFRTRKQVIEIVV